MLKINTNFLNSTFFVFFNTRLFFFIKTYFFILNFNTQILFKKKIIKVLYFLVWFNPSSTSFDNSNLFIYFKPRLLINYRFFFINKFLFVNNSKNLNYFFFLKKSNYVWLKPSLLLPISLFSNNFFYKNIILVFFNFFFKLLNFNLFTPFVLFHFLKCDFFHFNYYPLIKANLFLNVSSNINYTKTLIAYNWKFI